MKVGLYSRVSTQEQAREGYSIGEQVERMTKYADAMGWTVYKTYTDGGYSGANTDRPALQSMIQDIKDGKIEKVIVYKLDRLSRSQLDTLYLIEKIFLLNGCDFISMSENFDTSSPFGRAMIGILAVFAQLEREQIKERMLVGKEGRAKEGLWHGGGISPIGYDYDKTTQRLTTNEFEAMCVREIFENFEKGISLHALETIFLKKGYKHKYGVFSAHQIRRTLLNPLYAGYIYHKGQLIEGKHEALVSKDRFDAIQVILKERAKNYRLISNNWKQSTLLGGLIYCKYCGGKYTKQLGKVYKGKPAPIYYTCYSRSKKVKTMVKDPNCKNKNWKTYELDNIILNEIKKLSLDPTYVDQLKNHEEDNSKEKQVIIEKEILRLNNQISKIMDLYVIGSLSIDLIEDKIKPLEEQKSKLETELKELEKIERKMTSHEVVKIAKDFETILENGDFDEIRFIIEELVEKVVVDNDDVIIHWRFV